MAAWVASPAISSPDRDFCLNLILSENRFLCVPETLSALIRQQNRLSLHATIGLLTLFLAVVAAPFKSKSRFEEVVLIWVKV
jgi:hypothetical protein